jgi:biotin synthase
MKTDITISKIIDDVLEGYLPTKNDLIYLLQIPPHSIEAGYVIATANTLNRTVSTGKAEVHAQIGINLSPCPINCSFCSFAQKNNVFNENTELTREHIVQAALNAEKQGANALYFMTTGDYPFDKFIELSSEVRSNLKTDTVMIANIGDINNIEAKQLKDTGYTGIYHAVRMGEGRETNITPEIRLNTIKAATDAGLLIGTCVEPIGPEHTKEEIVEKILIAREMNPCFSGAMRRINIHGSPLEQHGMISEYHLAYVVAVVRLAMGNELIGNCTHEPNKLGATSGANLFWAEVGTNPRDTKIETATGRGLEISSCIDMFKEVDFEILQGPSRIFRDKTNN